MSSHIRLLGQHAIENLVKLWKVRMKENSIRITVTYLRCIISLPSVFMHNKIFLNPHLNLVFFQIFFQPIENYSFWKYINTYIMISKYKSFRCISNIYQWFMKPLLIAKLYLVMFSEGWWSFTNNSKQEITT